MDKRPLSIRCEVAAMNLGLRIRYKNGINEVLSYDCLQTYFTGNDKDTLNYLFNVHKSNKVK